MAITLIYRRRYQLRYVQGVSERSELTPCNIVCLHFSEVWEQRPMVLRRHKPHYNDGLLSTDALDAILREVQSLLLTEIDSPRNSLAL